MAKKILIFGQGQLGTAYRQWYESNGDTVFSPKLDIRNSPDILGAVLESKPDLIVNCVAKTSIDWCDQNRLEAVDVNVLGADNIGAAAEQAGVKLVHLSSGCIQESVAPDDVKTETDEPHPVCFYSWTKVWAENLLVERARRGTLDVLILRPRQLLSAAASPRNALVKFLTYSKFIDTPQSCTIIEDLLWATEQLVSKESKGVYNVVNPGIMTPLTIAEMLKQNVKPDMHIEAISKADLNKMTLARRIDAVLSTAKIEALGIKLPDIKPRLQQIMAELKINLDKAEGQSVLEATRAETAAKLALVK
jgi:dTDP-4-dehydrorhamnose reductase